MQDFGIGEVQFLVFDAGFAAFDVAADVVAIFRRRELGSLRVPVAAVPIDIADFSCSRLRAPLPPFVFAGAVVLHLMVVAHVECE